MVTTDSRLRAAARGRDGDRINAVLAAAGYNFILLLRWRNTLSSGMLTTRFLFPKFFPKNLAKKLGRVLQPEISGMVCVRVRSCSTPPRFRADEKIPPGVLPEGRISRRGIRPSLGRSAGLVTSFMPGPATFLPHLISLAGI